MEILLLRSMLIPKRPKYSEKQRSVLEREMVRPNNGISDVHVSPALRSLTTLSTIVSLSNSLLLLSQAQAKSALALKRFLKQHPEGVQRSSSSGSGDATITSSLSQKERLRATVRGALDTRNEADISDSVFLGRATSSPAKQSTQKSNAVPTTEAVSSERPTTTSDTSTVHNPVDEM